MLQGRGSMGQGQGQGPSSMGAPDPYTPYVPFDPYQDPETQRRASNAGRSAMFGGLLNSYLNRGQGVGDAFTGMQEARQGVVDRATQEAHIRAQERLAHERESRDRENDVLARRINEEKLAQSQREEQERLARRGAVSRSAPEIVAHIEQALGPDSMEAARARSLASLGEDADLDRLDTLYGQVIERKRFPETARMKTDAEIDEIRRKVAAGVEEDPLAAGRRAERGLALEAERSRAYLSNRDDGAYRSPTTAQFANDVEQEIDKLVRSSLTMMEQTNGVPPERMAAKREAVRELAERAVRARYGSYRNEKPAGHAEPTTATDKLNSISDAVIRKRVDMARAAGHSDESIVAFLGLM